MSHDAANFARVYEEHVWRVYGFVAFRVRDRDLAEDLTQLTFERALRAWSRFDRRRASELTWLLAIARNALIDQQRRTRERVEFDDRRSDDADSGTAPGPEERLGPSPQLAEALSQLSDRDREVVALRFGGDMTGAEIAALLDLSVGNVQQILSRSLRRLRTALEPRTVGDRASAKR